MKMINESDTEIIFITLDARKSENSKFWDRLPELSLRANKTVPKKEYVNSLRQNFRMKY